MKNHEGTIYTPMLLSGMMILHYLILVDKLIKQCEECVQVGHDLRQAASRMEGVGLKSRPARQYENKHCEWLAAGDSQHKPFQLRLYQRA